jgi:Peptidase family M1 domain
MLVDNTGRTRLSRENSRISQGFLAEHVSRTLDGEGAFLGGNDLETQTRPAYDRTPSLDTVVHDTAHMWYGDSVTLAAWPDIWLNEGFATYADWLWSEDTTNGSTQDIFDRLYRTPATDTAFWTPPPGDPGDPRFLFNGTIYDRGAMTLRALRATIGSEPFLAVLRTLGRRPRLRQRNHRRLHHPFRTDLGPRPRRPLRRLAPVRHVRTSSGWSSSGFG